MAAYVGTTWASIAALATFVLTYRWKFPYSVISDQWQYVAMVGALVTIMASGRQDTAVLNWTPIDPKWLTPACIGLAAGPFIDGQQFQRAAATTSMRPWIIASAAFGLYMMLVFGAYISQSRLANILLAITVIAVATSTLDSCVASLQDLIGDRWAMAVSLGAFITWPLFESRTAVQVWTWYATARIFVVIPMIIYTIWEDRQWKNGKKNYI